MNNLELRNIRILLFTFNSNIEEENINKLDLNFDRYVLVALRNYIELKNIQ